MIIQLMDAVAVCNNRDHPQSGVASRAAGSPESLKRHSTRSQNGQQRHHMHAAGLVDVII